MTTAELLVRKHLCATCPSPCSPRPDITRDDVGCPLAKPRFTTRAAKPKPSPIGLGDVVAAVAQPIARAIDRVAGTKVAECGGCKKRRERLNRIVPRIMP